MTNLPVFFAGCGSITQGVRKRPFWPDFFALFLFCKNCRLQRKWVRMVGKKNKMRSLMLLLFLLVVTPVSAGDLVAPALPSDPGSAMYSLEDIYNRLNAGTAGAKRTGGFAEPTSAPAASRHTMDEIMSKAPAADNTNGATAADVACNKVFWGLRTDGSWGEKVGAKACYPPAQVSKTGQVTPYVAGDDGVLQPGVVWPVPRFTNNGNGTVTDNLTGLVWMQNANCWERQTWTNALAKVAGLNAGSQSCTGYTTGTHTNWHLPTKRELMSLIDSGRSYPALPSGHPFSGVQTNNYWSSTTNANNTSNAWYVDLNNGYVNGYDKTISSYVWPVRGGQ